MVGVVLRAQGRAVAGKGAARQIRRMGRIPGIVYGKGKDNVQVSLDAGEFNRLLATTGVGQLVNLEVVVGDEVQSRPTLLKDVQYDPVVGDVLHVDFHEVALDEPIKTFVEIVLVDEGEGTTRDGGIVSQLLREIEVECLPTNIPDQVSVNVTGLSIGDSVTVGDLEKLPGVEFITPVEEIVVTVTAPTTEVVEEETADEAEEATEEADEEE